MVALTRNAAKKLDASVNNHATPVQLNQGGAVVTVSPSATGKGRHTRWQYLPSIPEPTIAGDISSDSLSSGSSGSMSSLSTLSDSSFASSSSSRSQSPVPLPQHVARILQHSSGQLWTKSGGADRLTLVPDSFTEEAVNMRESMRAKKLEDVFNKQWELMVKKRQADMESFGVDWTENEDSDVEMEMGFVREDTVFVGDDAMCQGLLVHSFDTSEPPRQRGPPLGPHGTELIDPDTHAYPPRTPNVSLADPSSSVSAPSTSRGLRWEPTEPVIS